MKHHTICVGHLEYEELLKRAKKLGRVSIRAVINQLLFNQPKDANVIVKEVPA